MNWKSIKTFLIFLFLIVNIFLIFLTIQMNNAQKLNDNDISETITLLKKNNISIDSNIIPRVPSESDIIHLTDIYFAGNLNIPDIQRTETGVEIKLPFENSDSSSLEDAINETLKKHGFDTKNIKLSKSDNQYIMTYYVDGIPVFNNNLTISVSDNELALTGTWYVNESKNTYTWQQAGTSYATSALVNFISHPERDKS